MPHVPTDRDRLKFPRVKEHRNKFQMLDAPKASQAMIHEQPTQACLYGTTRNPKVERDLRGPTALYESATDLMVAFQRCHRVLRSFASIEVCQIRPRVLIAQAKEVCAMQNTSVSTG
jgi:hypothetical protein